MLRGDLEYDGSTKFVISYCIQRLAEDTSSPLNFYAAYDVVSDTQM